MRTPIRSESDAFRLTWAAAGVIVCSWEARPGAVQKGTPQEITGLSHLYVNYGNRTPTITLTNQESPECRPGRARA